MKKNSCEVSKVGNANQYGNDTLVTLFLELPLCHHITASVLGTKLISSHFFPICTNKFCTIWLQSLSNKIPYNTCKKNALFPVCLGFFCWFLKSLFWPFLVVLRCHCVEMSYIFSLGKWILPEKPLASFNSCYWIKEEIRIEI